MQNAKVRPRQLLKTMSYSRLGTAKENAPAQKHLKNKKSPPPKKKRVVDLAIGHISYILFRIPDICQFWYTTVSFRPVKVHQQVHKLATKYQKKAKIVRSLC